MTPGSTQSPGINKVIRHLVRPILFIIGLIFFIVLAIRGWEETRQFLSAIKWGFFLLSVLIGILDHVVVSIFFQALLRKYGMRLPYYTVGRMYFFGQMSKYIPGRFWNVLYQRSFVPRYGATLSLFLVNVETLAAFIFRNAFIGLTLMLVTIQAVAALLIYFLGASGFVFVGHTSRVVRTLHWTADRLKKPFDDTESIVEEVKPGWLFLIYLLATFTFLTSNLLMMYAAFNFSPAESYIYIAYLGIAWVIGVITIFVPAGMGVREVVFLSLANVSGTTLSVETLTAIAVVYRFWHVLQELGGVVFAYLLTRMDVFQQNQKNTNENPLPDCK
jgi:uncharacterized membrane protein YbhN (UPF0104 family)